MSWRIAPASTKWEVSIDSRSHDHHGVVRMLMPLDDEPRIVEFPPDNDAPVLAPVGDQTTTGATELTFTATATDTPGQDLNYTLEDGESGAVPTGATISAEGDFTWTPTADQTGTHTFDIVVTDDGTPNLQDRETITITVTAANTAPLLDPIGNQTAIEGMQLAFTATANDNDLPAQQLRDQPARRLDPAGQSHTLRYPASYSPRLTYP